MCILNLSNAFYANSDTLLYTNKHYNKILQGVDLFNEFLTSLVLNIAMNLYISF